MLAVKLILLGAVMTNVTAYFAGGGVRAPVCEMAAKGFGQSSSKPTGKTKPDRSRKVEGERGYHTTSFHNTDSYYTSNTILLDQNTAGAVCTCQYLMNATTETAEAGQWPLRARVEHKLSTSCSLLASAKQ